MKGPLFDLHELHCFLVFAPTWMSRDGSAGKWLGSMAYTTNISHLYVGCKPFANHLLTSWDIQVGPKICLTKLSFGIAPQTGMINAECSFEQ